MYCCDRKAQVASVQSFTQCQQATTEITLCDYSVIVCSRHMYIWVLFFAHIPFVVNHIFNATSAERLQQHPLPFTTNHTDHTFFFAKPAPGTTFTSWSQHHFVAIGKPERQVCKASHCGSKQQ